MKCPNCKTHSFITKSYETVEIDQCKTCHGIWLDEGEMIEIIDNVATDFSEDEIRKTVSSAFMGVPANEKDNERLCPKCQSPLNIINYSVDSGIIIDVCPHNHGVFLDPTEIERVQQYREYWRENIYKNHEHFTKMIEDYHPSRKVKRLKKDEPKSLFEQLFFFISK